MREAFLTPNQGIDQLVAGRSVEQWLGHTNKVDYLTIKWLWIDPEQNGQISAVVFEVFDDGNPDFLDIYAFEPVDPDASNGIITSFDTPESAIDFALTHNGADKNHFVGGGRIQDLYASFLQENG